MRQYIEFFIVKGKKKKRYRGGVVLGYFEK